jgi:trehalose/maltose hydrolase-like predicted phosphorylase/ActR/RegA family two-component response regulator
VPEQRQDNWRLVYEGFRPAEEGLREALCTLGNGYFATRGAASESGASRIHYPGTYIAGVYNKLPTHIAGRTVYNEDLVNCPNWLFLTFKIDAGAWVNLAHSRILFYRQQLDMRRGLLLKKMCLEDAKGRRTIIEAQRFIHMRQPHHAAIRYLIRPQNYEGRITVISALDGTVQNTGVARYRQLNCRHLRLCKLGDYSRNGIYLLVKTSHSQINIAQAARLRVFTDNKEIRPVGKTLIINQKKIAQEFEIFVHKGGCCEIEKSVAVYTSKDKDMRGEPLESAINSVQTCARFHILFKSHWQVWDELWRKFDIVIEGDSFAQKVIRLHTFHLLQTASFHNTRIDAGLPARGLHGEAYRGHIFWDGLFTMPFFDLHMPQVSRALLLYRYRRLAAARRYAQKNGYAGAMFPWQSGSTGEEETQIIHLNPMSGKWGPDYSRLQRHVSFAIAYNVWQYWKKTGDIDFFMHYGAEILLSIAQFATSLAKYSPKDGRYHTKGVMGPDEFHEKFPRAPKPGLKDNAYTNILIVWTLLKAQQALEILPRRHKRRLFVKLGVNRKELYLWEDISRRMNIVINKEGIVSQFDGYFKLRELNWAAYRQKYGNIQRMDRILKAEGKSPNDYKVAKQADVLMIFYLFTLSEAKDLFQRLGYDFSYELLKKNYEYYIRRTSHGSTLSKVVHCYVAYLVGKLQESWQWFLDVLRSDIYDIQGGTTPEGIHMGVMGGSIDITRSIFAGITIVDGYERIKIEPNLPLNWTGISLKFCYRSDWIFLSVTEREITILIQGKKGKLFSVPVEIYGKLHHFVRGKTYRIHLKKPPRLLKEKKGIEMVQERILIVDSDISLSEILETRLENLGYMVDCTRSGTEALGILRREWIDLVVLDVSLEPGISGYQLFKEIKKRKEFSDIPIVVQSSKPAMKKIFERLGAQRFLVKPYSVDIFLDEIGSILTNTISRKTDFA